MAESNRKKLFLKLRDKISLEKSSIKSEDMFINLNSCNQSSNTSLIRQGLLCKNQENRSKLSQALSARKLQKDSSQLILRQINMVIGEENKKYQTKENTRIIEDVSKQNIYDRFDSKKKQKQSTLRNQSSQDQTRCNYKNGDKSPNQSHKIQSKVTIRCRQCDYQFKLKQQQNQLLSKKLKACQNKYSNLVQRYEKLKKKVQPYANNMNLLSVAIDSLQQAQQKLVSGQNKQQNTINSHTLSQLEQTSRVNKWLLKQGRQKEKSYFNQAYRLNCQIDYLKTQNNKLKVNITKQQNQLKYMEEQLKYYQCNNSMRERLQMNREELYTYKLKYQQKCLQNNSLLTKIQESKYKLAVLTSLIGCAIIFDLKQKQKDKKLAKQFINKIDKYQTIAQNILENNGFQYLKFYENCKQQSQISSTSQKTQTKGKGIQKQKTIVKTVHYRKIFYPNHLLLLGQQSISARIEHVVIKPLLFIKIRSILDSKYIDYRLFQTSASQFSDFCNTHLKNYDILDKEKKQHLIIRQISESQIRDINIDFLRFLLDQRIQDLPQVQMFRGFMLSKWEQDQIYFYLMCRHKLMEGSELQNFINSGDPSKLIKFDKAKRLMLKLTQSFGRNIQNFICHHINERRIIKNKQQFVRVYYLLKIILLIYRKIRVKRVVQFQENFDRITELTNKNYLTFIQFQELLKKNFQFLNRTDICKMYKTTYALFECQKNQPNFYQCFIASSISKIFLQELIKADKKLEIDCILSEEIFMFKQNEIAIQKKFNSRSKLMKKSVFKESQDSCCQQLPNSKDYLRMNQLTELWPDSVYSLGNQVLNKQYLQLLKASNPQQPRTKLQILTFLNNIVLAHLIRQNIYLRDKQNLNLMMSQSIFNCIEYLNKIEKKKIEYENEINSASKKIGKFFKNKIYQFYHQMLQDINNIKSKLQSKNMKDSHSQFKKSKRYVKQKIRASQILTPYRTS